MSETVQTPRPELVEDRASFAAALTRLREDADLSVRDVARRTGLRASTLGGWFSGLHLPQRTQRPALLDVLRACGVEADDLEAWGAALERVRTVPPPPGPRPDVAPYRGLLSYEASDAGWFFGRERTTATLVERTAALVRSDGPRVLTVVGASGAGKSSVLRAGLVPAVEEHGVPGRAARWTARVLTPGDDPRAALAALDDPAAAADAAAGDEPATLLVVDQLEEVFAAAVDPGDRSVFLDDLFARAESTAGTTVVVLGMRADFYGAAVRHPRLARALQDQQVVVPPMGEQELRAAIIEPARRAGVTVDPELVERLLRDAGVEGPGGTQDTGTLPLLSHALRATWERSSGRRLTTADYDATGGIAGSIEQTAEDVHASLDPDGQHLARQLFTRMVRVDEASGVVTRRPLGRADLPGSGGALAVLDAFVERRLVTTHADRVEIGHERLLTAWARIGEWIEADRDVLRARHQLSDAVQAWQTNDRDPAFLLTGTRLAAATELVAADAEGLSAAERELVSASVDAVEEDRRRQRHRLRRTQRLLALVAVLLVAASAATVVAVRATTTADAARRRAETAGRASLSRQVAIEARQVQARDPALAQQLAVAAWRTSPTTEARGALLDLAASPLVTRVLGVDGPTAVAVSPDGRTLAVGHADDGSVHLYALGGSTPIPVAVIPGPRNEQVYALRWWGSRLAVGGRAKVVTLYDVTAPARPTRLAALDAPFDAAVQAIAVSPDGRLLAAVSGGSNPVRVWDVSAAVPRFVAAPAGLPEDATEQTVTFSPDGRRLVAAGTAGTVAAWPTTDLAGATPTVVTTGTATVDAVVYDAHGQELYSGDKAGVVTVHDPVTLAGTATHPLATNGWVNTIAVSPDGSELAVGQSDGSLRRIGTSPWSPRRSDGNPGPVTGVAYTPDGRSLVSVSTDGTARISSTSGPLPLADSLTAFAVSFTRDGRTLGVVTSGSGGGTTALWDTSDLAKPVPAGPGPAAPGISGSGAVSPDGTLFAAGAADGTVYLWDIRDRSAPVLRASFAGAKGIVETVSFRSDGRVLGVGSDDKSLRLWDIGDPAHPAQLAQLTTGDFVFGATFSPDGQLVAAASADDHAYLWDVSDPAHPRPRARLGGFVSYVWSVAFSTDGRLLAAGGADRTTHLWDISAPDADPVPLARLTGPKGYNLAVAFSPDDRQLAVASNDGNVWVYDVADPRAASVSATLQDIGGNANAVAWSPDGSRLVGAGRADRVPLWPTDPDTAAGQICAVAGDRITEAEWREYVPDTAYRPPCG